MDGGSRVPPATRARGRAPDEAPVRRERHASRAIFPGRRVGPRASVGRPRGRGVADARLTPAAARGPVGGTRARHARVRSARARGPETRGTARGVFLARLERCRFVRSARRRRRRRRAMGGRAGDALLAREARARRGADAHARGSGRARERSAKNGDGGDAVAERGARARFARARQAAYAAALELASLELASLSRAPGLSHGRRVRRGPERGRGGGVGVRADGVRAAACERRPRRARRVRARDGGSRRRAPTRPARGRERRARASRGCLTVRASARWARTKWAAASARGRAGDERSGGV